MLHHQKNDSKSALESIWHLTGESLACLDRVVLSGSEPIFSSVYKTGVVSQTTIAAAGLAAAEIWKHRTGTDQTIKVDMTHSSVSFRSERYSTVDGKPSRSTTDDIHGFYKCGDAGWIQLHTNYPNHRTGIVKALGCQESRESVASSLKKLSSEEAENILTAHNLPAAKMRTREEWCKHQQGIETSKLPLLEIDKISDSEPIRFTNEAVRPLDSIKVLELTKVIAGPVIGRTLAEHGADVLWVNGPQLHLLEGLVIDMSRGKRPVNIDLDSIAGKNQLADLASKADVFVQGYRPGSISQKGFSPESLAKLNPGIICVELSAFSHKGPWANRRGFDSLLQTVSGIGHEGGRANNIDGMVHLPCQALDHATGYLGAMGAMIALLRRAREGGSWRVRVSLAQTAHWLISLGKMAHINNLDLNRSDVDQFLGYTNSPFGTVSYVKPAAMLSKTPGAWNIEPSPFGTYKPEWI